MRESETMVGQGREVGDGMRSVIDADVYLNIARAEARLLAERQEAGAIDQIIARNAFPIGGDWVDEDTGVIGRRRHAQEAVLRTQIPYNVYVGMGFHPIVLEDGVLTVASAGGWREEDKDAIRAIARQNGFEVDRVEVVIRDRASLIRAQRAFRTVTAEMITERARALSVSPTNGQLIGELLRDFITEALEMRASDIHFVWLPGSSNCWVSYRINGDVARMHLLHDVAIRPVMARIKQEARCPEYSMRDRLQRGRMSFVWAGRQIDIRVATAPEEPDGERVTLRLLDSATLPVFGDLFRVMPAVARRIEDIVDSPIKTGNVILLSGPTGQGKTTTLAATMMRMDRARKIIVEISNPVEYQIRYVSQQEVVDAPGRRFADHITNALIMDPDIIVISEVKDQDTAEAAMRCAETGHALFATVHANNCRQTIERMVSLFAPEYKATGTFILGDSLRVVMNQRLVKRVCPHCSVEREAGQILDPAMAKALDIEAGMTVRVTNQEGCDSCRGTGHIGRVLAAETLLLPESEEDRIRLVETLNHEQWSKLFELEGIQYTSRAEALGTLVRDGAVDPRIATAILRAR